MDVPFFFGALALYGAGTLAYLLLLSINKDPLARLATAVTAGGFVLHTIGLLLRLVAVRSPPLGSRYETLSFFAWATVLVYLSLERRFRTKVMGAFVLPIVLLTAASASILPKATGHPAPSIESTWIWIHVALLLLGNAAFALAFGAGVMYLLQDLHLKSKHKGTMYRQLPSLEFLDLLGHRALLVGFPLLTLGLLIGLLLAQAAWGGLLAWDPAALLSLVTWVLYAGLLQARLAVGWRGRKAALLSIVGFSMLLVTSVGVMMLLGQPHRVD